MTTPESELQRWEKIAGELRAYRKALRETWGDVSDVVLANYVAGAATPEETLAVEMAMKERPAVRELVEVVRESLMPVWVTRPAKSGAVSTERKIVMLLREALRLSVDDARRAIAQGVEYLIRPAQAPAVDMALGSSTDEVCWLIPAENSGVELSIRAKATAEPGKWLLGCELLGDPAVAKEAWFSLSKPNGLPLVDAELAKFKGRFVELAAGPWELTVTLNDVVCVVPIIVGETSSSDN